MNLNAILNFALIPSFGATAAAFTTGLTELVILALLLKENFTLTKHINSKKEYLDRGAGRPKI